MYLQWWKQLLHSLPCGVLFTILQGTPHPLQQPAVEEVACVFELVAVLATPDCCSVGCLLLVADTLSVLLLLFAPPISLFNFKSWEATSEGSYSMKGYIKR